MSENQLTLHPSLMLLNQWYLKFLHRLYLTLFQKCRQNRFLCLYLLLPKRQFPKFQRLLRCFLFRKSRTFRCRRLSQMYLNQ
jgi:hypothetical protein